MSNPPSRITADPQWFSVGALVQLSTVTATPAAPTAPTPPAVEQTIENLRKQGEVEMLTGQPLLAESDVMDYRMKPDEQIDALKEMNATMLAMMTLMSDQLDYMRDISNNTKNTADAIV